MALEVGAAVLPEISLKKKLKTNPRKTCLDV